VEPTAEGLASGVSQVLGDREAASARARAGLELIRREYSAERYTERVQRAYASLEAAARKTRRGASTG
jgi:hypothetical protein